MKPVIPTDPALAMIVIPTDPALVAGERRNPFRFARRHGLLFISPVAGYRDPSNAKRMAI